MITLGLDTSTARGSIALLRDNQPLAEEIFLRGDGKHVPEQHLLGALDKLLTEQKLTPTDINLFAVGIGRVLSRVYAWALPPPRVSRCHGRFRSRALAASMPWP